MALQLSGSIILSGSLTVSGSLVATNTTTTLFFNDMEFTHVSGSRSFYSGVGTAYSCSSFGAGVSQGNLVLIPTAPSPNPEYSNFKSETSRYKVVGYRMFTNVSGSDFPVYNYQSDGPNLSYLSLGVASMNAPNSATSGQLVSNVMYSLTQGQYDGADGYGWIVVPTGSVLSNPPTEIKDTGTLYISSSINNPINIGPTVYGPVYYTFLMSIGAGFKSKKYKFRFELDCVKY